MSLLWGALTPLLALVLLRFLKAMLIALQYRNKAEEGRLPVIELRRPSAE